MKNPFLTAQKIYLRPVEPSDADIFASCANDPQVRKTFFTHTPTSLFREEGKIEDLYKPGADYIPLIIAAAETDEAVGLTAFHRVDWVSRAAIWSVCICKAEHWGRGYASEVTRLMLRYAFDILNLHRVQLHVWTGNEAGVKAYERAGFRREGLLREAMKHEGNWCDFHVMGILEDEWRTDQRNAESKSRPAS